MTTSQEYAERFGWEEPTGPVRIPTIRYWWVEEWTGVKVSAHIDLYDAGRHHRRLCRADLILVDRDGKDWSNVAILSSVEW